MEYHFYKSETTNNTLIISKVKLREQNVGRYLRYRTETALGVQFSFKFSTLIKISKNVCNKWGTSTDIANTVTAGTVLFKINRLHRPLNMVRPMKLHIAPAQPRPIPWMWSLCLMLMWTLAYVHSPAKPRGSATAPSVGSTVPFTTSPP